MNERTDMSGISMDFFGKRILVTGGAGFLGSHLCDKLIERGHDVLCVDNFFTGRRGNVSHLLGNPHFELLRHDVTFPLYIEVDQIYNLACPASPVHYQFDPVQTTKTSVVGAINMLGLAKRLKIPFSRHRRQKYTVILVFILSPKNTGVTSIRLVPAPVMMKGSAAQRRFSLIIIDSTNFRSR